MEEVAISVPAYDPRRGLVAPVEGGTLTVEIDKGSTVIHADAAGWRDLARWCLALSDARAPSGAHIHLDPGAIPLALESAPLLLAREDSTNKESRVPRIRRGAGVDPAMEWENMAVLLTLQASQGLIGPQVTGMSVQVNSSDVTIHVCLRANSDDVAEDLDDLVFELESLLAGVVIPHPTVTVAPYVGPLDARWPGYGHRRIFSAHDRDS